MADVTTVFAAKDESFAKTVDKLQGRLTGFSGGVESFNSKVAGMASSFAKFAGPIAGVATAFFGAKAAVESFGSALSMGGRLDDLSKRTGASAGEMLLLEKSFELAGSSAEAVGPTISKLNRFLAESSVAGSAQDEALRGLGLSYQRLAELSPTEQMKLLAERIAAIQNPAMQTQAAMAVFGKTGGELIPLLTDFSGELSKARGFLGSLPGIMTENAAAFANLDDNIREVRNKFDQFVAGLITGLVPALTSVTDKLANLDAAGLGKAFSGFITSAAQSISNSYLLGDAIDNVKTAIDAIISGNYSEGLSLMWVTMKITALNAVNEIVKNFTAGLQTIGDFMSETMGPESALFRLVGNAFSLMALNFESAMSRAIANMVAVIPGFGASAAAALREAADQAKTSADLLTQEMKAGVKVVADEMTAAGAALPQSFADNKAALDPLFNLTDEFAEQKTLQEAINAELAKAQPVAEAIAAAGTDYAAALEGATNSLQSSDALSSSIALNLESAAMSSDRIAPAFSLGEESSGQVAMDLESTVPHAEQSSEFLAEGAAATNALDINGRSYAASAEAAAANIAAAKVDAQITADAFTGMSDRMNSGANAVNSSLDKMREAFHFGQKTQQEVYQSARDSGQSMIEASKTAADYMRNQEKASSDMRDAENKVRIAENKREEAYNRAERMEANKQDTAANNLRRRADEAFTKTMEKLGTDLEKGADAAKKALEEGSVKAKDNLDTSGSAAGQSLRAGGQDAANALKQAIAPPGDDRESVLQNIYDFFRNTFFKDFQKRLPQNALS